MTVPVSDWHIAKRLSACMVEKSGLNQCRDQALPFILLSLKLPTMNKKINCVLLIDDDEPTNYLSQMILEEAGCVKEIKVASSGDAALKYLTKADDQQINHPEYPKPDLILLDINMPAMNGWEFLEEYESIKNRYKEDVVIIMLTTSLNPDDRLRAEGIPTVRGFEHKPLTEEMLEDIFEKYFPENN